MPELTREKLSRNFNPEFPDIDFDRPNDEAQRIYDEYPERYDRGSDELKKAEECFATLIKMVNTMSSTHTVAYGLARQLLNEHRTLQQSLVGEILKGLLMYMEFSKEHGYHDARNEATVNMAEDIKNLVEGHHLPFI